MSAGVRCLHNGLCCGTGHCVHIARGRPFAVEKVNGVIGAVGKERGERALAAGEHVAQPCAAALQVGDQWSRRGCLNLCQHRRNGHSGQQRISAKAPIDVAAQQPCANQVVKPANEQVAIGGCNAGLR